MDIHSGPSSILLTTVVEMTQRIQKCWGMFYLKCDIEHGLNGRRSLHEVCGKTFMFLSNPTISELKLLDLSSLMEMLSHQTEAYIKLFNEEGFTARTISARELLHNVQEAIELKRVDERSPMKTQGIVSQGTTYGNADKKLS